MQDLRIQDRREDRKNITIQYLSFLITKGCNKSVQAELVESHGFLDLMLRHFNAAALRSERPWFSILVAREVASAK